MRKEHAEVLGTLLGNSLAILALFLYLLCWAGIVWGVLALVYGVIAQDFGSGLRPLVEAVWCGKPGCWK